jgi:SOS-response transcriptional repressor LexA
MAITATQRRVYDALHKFQQENGYTPSTRELAVVMGRSQTAAQQAINKLIVLGFARRHSYRSIVLMPLQ